jgi:hypothetical protein
MFNMTYTNINCFRIVDSLCYNAWPVLLLYYTVELQRLCIHINGGLAEAEETSGQLYYG